MLLGPVRKGEQQTTSEDTVVAVTSEEAILPGPEHGGKSFGVPSYCERPSYCLPRDVRLPGVGQQMTSPTQEKTPA